MNIVIAPKSPLAAAAEWLAQGRRSSTLVSVGIEAESLTAGMRDRLAATLKGKLRLRSAPPLVERARMVKDAAEILRIRRAVELGASLFAIARKKIRPGVREVEVAAAMEYEARRAGAEGMSFPTILASGPRSAIVHGRASSARIPRRGFVAVSYTHLDVYKRQGLWVDTPSQRSGPRMRLADSGSRSSCPRCSPSKPEARQRSARSFMISLTLGREIAPKRALSSRAWSSI